MLSEYCGEELGLKQKQVEMTWSEQHALCSTLPGHPTTTRGAGESQNLIDFPPGYTMHRQIRDMPLLLHALKQQLWELSFTWLLKLPRLLFYNSVLLDSLHTTTHSKDTKLQNSNPCSKTQETQGLWLFWLLTELPFPCILSLSRIK